MLNNKAAVMAVITAALLMTGCTTYGEMGFTGGVSATQIDGNTFRIESRGNAFAGSSQIKDFAMMRAAEATLQSGNDYFVIVTAEDMSRTDISVTPRTATSQTNVFGNTATTQTTYSGGEINSYDKPGQDLIIKVFKGDKPQNNPNAYSAREIVQFLGPKVKKS